MKQLKIMRQRLAMVTKSTGGRAWIAAVTSFALLLGPAALTLTAHAASSPAAPVRATAAQIKAGPLIGGTDYSIENVGEFATLESNGGNQRMTLGGNSEFYETGDAYTWEGATYYQWELSTKDGYCIETSSNGAAHLIMAVCNSSKLTQYFWNPSLVSSSWLSLESSMTENTAYGVYAENSTAVAVALLNFGTTFEWTFVKD